MPERLGLQKTILLSNVYIKFNQCYMFYVGLTSLLCLLGSSNICLINVYLPLYYNKQNFNIYKLPGAGWVAGVVVGVVLG